MYNILLSGNTSSVGGGEVLQYVGNDMDKKEYIAMDNDFIHQLSMMPGVKIAIILLILTVAVLIMLKILEVKSPFKGKAITNELDHLDKVKKHDEAIIKTNKSIATITKIIENTPLSLDKSYLDYWTYNLERANIRIPGGYRVMQAKEFNALIRMAQCLIIVIAMIIAIFINGPVGAIITLLTIVLGNTLPMMIVRSQVKTKDAEIIENFADFYLMLHYVLLASAGTPIAGIMKSYDKTTSSEEMHRFVDVCIHYIDTYGEYDATRYIAKQYREVPQVGKLMRLIRQSNEGGDVRAELMGFRSELLEAKKYTIRKRMEKIVGQAKLSFNLLMIVLFQAIVSAMAIYLPDLGLMSSFMG